MCERATARRVRSSSEWHPATGWWRPENGNGWAAKADHAQKQRQGRWQGSRGRGVVARGGQRSESSEARTIPAMIRIQIHRIECTAPADATGTSADALAVGSAAAAAVVASVAMGAAAVACVDTIASDTL